MSARGRGSGIRQRMRAVGPDAFESSVAGARLIFPASSWANARAAGASFDDVLEHMSPRAWIVLEQLARGLGLSEIYVTSMWRASGTGPHTSGRGLDVGYLRRPKDAALTLLSRGADELGAEPPLAAAAREQLQRSTQVTQVLTPWWMFSKGSYDRPNDSTSPLDVEHLTHLHVTLASGDPPIARARARSRSPLVAVASLGVAALLVRRLW